MKEKLIIAISLTIMLLIAGGCSVTANDNNDESFTIVYSNEIKDGYFLSDGVIDVVRDNETGREYILYNYGTGVVITPRLDKTEGTE
jgi:CRP-like cAMP-binding protein